MPRQGRPFDVKRPRLVMQGTTDGPIHPRNSDRRHRMNTRQEKPLAGEVALVTGGSRSDQAALEKRLLVAAAGDVSLCNYILVLLTNNIHVRIFCGRPETL